MEAILSGIFFVIKMRLLMLKRFLTLLIIIWSQWRNQSEIIEKIWKIRVVLAPSIIIINKV